MKLVFKRSALKRLIGMQPSKARTIRRRLDRIAADPFAKDNNLLPLSGVPGGYRLRVGDWRVSFLVDKNQGVVEVFEVEPRGGAYR